MQASLGGALVAFVVGVGVGTVEGVGVGIDVGIAVAFVVAFEATSRPKVPTLEPKPLTKILYSTWLSEDQDKELDSPHPSSFEPKHARFPQLPTKRAKTVSKLLVPHVLTLIEPPVPRTLYQTPGLPTSKQLLLELSFSSLVAPTVEPI
mmetsp:Transcript_16393/g.27766  ORF Transcript_16393/g.27766 Transcript_16393/m.27766 type:complete len:149 (-) Transcript_16393:108-554(-)